MAGSTACGSLEVQCTAPVYPGVVLLAASCAVTVTLKATPAVAVAGAARAKCVVVAAVTASEAVPVLPEVCVPVTVCGPATEALQLAPVQEPSGAIVKVVAAVTSPSVLLNASRPSAVYVSEPPELIVAEAGASTR